MIYYINFIFEHFNVNAYFKDKNRNKYIYKCNFRQKLTLFQINISIFYTIYLFNLLLVQYSKYSYFKYFDILGTFLNEKFPIGIRDTFLSFNKSTLLHIR
jgi:hypothetical protein